MRKRCEKLRENALKNGMNSKDAQIWREHALDCDRCRTDLFILESLERQAQNDRQHLNNNQIADLLQTASNKYPEISFRDRFHTWSNRIAIAVAAVIVMAFTFHIATNKDSGMQTADNKKADKEIISWEDITSGFSNFTSASTTKEDKETTDEWTNNQRLNNLRHNLDYYKKNLNYRISQENSGSGMLPDPEN